MCNVFVRFWGSRISEACEPSTTLREHLCKPPSIYFLKVTLTKAVVVEVGGERKADGLQIKEMNNLGGEFKWRMRMT